jgi:uncharacterized protein (DUF488 family)
MDCHDLPTIHTIGHSTRTIETFIELLRAHNVQLVVDVRRWPASRRFPQFKREALAEALKQSGLDYIWRGDLGGFRKPRADSPNTAWRVESFRAYADFMLTDEFDAIMAQMETIAADRRLAFMCAEAVPWRCHRQLIADALVVRGWPVRHIMDAGCRQHVIPAFADVEGNKIFYRGSPDARPRRQRRQKLE